MSKVCQLFSGSGGNSIFIQNGKTSFLVDAGVSAKKIENALIQIGEDAKNLSAVFITHEHSDHIGGVRVLCSRYNIPLFANNKTITSMEEKGVITNQFSAQSIEEKTEFPTFVAEPFKLSHDSVDCQGYKFTLNDGRRVSVCTDTGFVTDSAKNVILGSDLVFLESNHEIRMVENGSYPYILKKRILSQKGHLSNVACGEFARELVKNGTTRIVLSHLSRDNNMPEIAFQTTSANLLEIGATNGCDYRLLVSKPENIERAIIL